MLEKVLQQSGFWTSCGPFSHVVLSTRIRIARNMKSVLFPNRLIREDMSPIQEAVGRFVRDSSFRGPTCVIDLRQIDSNEKRFLRERNVITCEMEISDNSMVAVNNTEDFSILINEEDHFRIQVIRPGLQLVDAYKAADRVDTELNKFTSYAFSEELGYLTACVSNLGTGLKVSFLLHLPVITMKNMMHDLIPEEKKNRVEIKGTIGKNSKSLGSLYQLSSRTSLGISEIDIIESMDEVLSGILEIEDAGRDELYTESKLDLENRIWRSFGILQYSRRLGYIESMDHLSNLRLGIILAVIKNIDVRVINDLMVNIQWAHLQRNYGLLFKSTDECDEYRAGYMRKILSAIEVR